MTYTKKPKQTRYQTSRYEPMPNSTSTKSDGLESKCDTP